MGIVPAGTDGACIFGNGSEDANLLLDDGFFRRVVAEAGMDEARLEIAGAFATRDPHIERIGLTFLSELEWGGPGEALYAESLANLLALHLIRHHSSVGRRAKARLDREASAGLPGSALKRAIVEHVEDNLAGELTLEVLARGGYEPVPLLPRLQARHRAHPPPLRRGAQGRARAAAAGARRTADSRGRPRGRLLRPESPQPALQAPPRVDPDPGVEPRQARAPREKEKDIQRETGSSNTSPSLR